MSLKAIGLSRATSRGLINSFNHRILGLEIDLQQLSKERSINKKIYSKKIKLLKNLQSKLQFFQNNFEVQGRKKPHGIFQKQIPERESRSPEETDLCISYFEKSIELVSELINESNDIVKILQTIFNGRWFQFLTFLDLSKLRKKMLNLENKQETLLQSKNKWNKFVDDVLDKTRVVSLSGFNQTRVQMLKNYFFELELLHKEIVNLTLDSDRLEEDINLRENWLSFQEWRLNHDTSPSSSSYNG